MRAPKRSLRYSLNTKDHVVRKEAGGQPPLISTHAEKGVDMTPHMPRSPQNSGRALHNDWEWWSDHADEVNERFSAWLAR